jgi:hypothetical protein
MFVPNFCAPKHNQVTPATTLLEEHRAIARSPDFSPEFFAAADKHFSTLALRAPLAPDSRAWKVAEIIMMRCVRTEDARRPVRGAAGAQLPGWPSGSMGDHLH